MLTLAGLAAAWLLKHFTFEVLKTIFWKAFLIALFLLIGPIVILKGFTLISEAVLEYAGEYLGESGLTSPSFSFSGFAGGLLSYLRIGDALAVLLSFAAVNATLRILRLK